MMTQHGFGMGHLKHFRSMAGGLLCSLLLAAPAAAVEKPWRLSLVGDAYDGKVWHTGVKIELDDGWKTYWRMPGESGVPPEFTWTTSVPASVSLRFPAPARYEDASGETVGYEHQVVFPVTVDAGDATGVDVSLDLFFAVCKDICIPAKGDARISLGPMQRDPEGAAAVSEAEGRVPREGQVAEKAEIIIENGAPALRLALSQRVDDIFAETASSAYFRQPRFSADGKVAVLPIDNVKDPLKLKGAALTLTARSGTQGLEQRLTLP